MSFLKSPAFLLTLIFVLLLPGSAHSKKKEPHGWAFNYIAKNTYIYDLSTTSTYSYGTRNTMLTFDHFIESKLEITIKKTTKKGSSGVLIFKDFSASIAFNNGQKRRLKGQPASVKYIFEHEKIEKLAFKIYLPKSGGIEFKDKRILSLKKLFEKDFKGASKVHTSLEKVIKYFFTNECWEDYLNWHFMPVTSKEKLPGKNKRLLQVFEAKNNIQLAMNAANVDRDMTIEKNEDGSAELSVKFSHSLARRNDLGDGNFYIQEEMNSGDNEYSLSKDGHFLNGSYNAKASSALGSEGRAGKLVHRVKYDVSSSLKFAEIKEPEIKEPEVKK